MYREIKKTNRTFDGNLLSLLEEEYYLTRLSLNKSINRALERNGKSKFLLGKQLNMTSGMEINDMLFRDDILLSELIKIAATMNLGVEISFRKPRVSNASALKMIQKNMYDIDNKVAVLKKDITITKPNGKCLI